MWLRCPFTLLLSFSLLSYHCVFFLCFRCCCCCSWILNEQDDAKPSQSAMKRKGKKNANVARVLYTSGWNCNSIQMNVCVCILIIIHLIECETYYGCMQMQRWKMTLQTNKWTTNWTMLLLLLIFPSSLPSSLKSTLEWMSVGSKYVRQIGIYDFNFHISDGLFFAQCSTHLLDILKKRVYFWYRWKSSKSCQTVLPVSQFRVNKWFIAVSWF